MTVKLSRRRFLGLLGAAGCVGAGPLLAACSRSAAPTAAVAPRVSKSPPNVLVIVLDTVRRDRFTRSGQSLTPHLDRITASGARFENAWSTSSWSLPSQASIMTGHYAHEHHADWPGLALAPRVPTLAEFFASRGYVTGAFSGNAAWITPEYLGRGFLRFEVYTFEDLLRRTVLGRVANRLAQEVELHEAGRGKKAPTIDEELLRFLDDYRGRPFFAYLCYMDVNQGFHDRQLNTYFRRQAPTSEVIEAYDQSLQTLDGQLGGLFDELRARGVLENTLVVVASDHGESFGARDSDDHDPTGHGTSLYPEQSRVPLFVTYPGKVQPGRVSDAVSISAIPATITHLLGLAESPFPGRPLIGPGRFGPAEDAILTTLNYGDRKLQAVVRGSLQYIQDLARPDRGEELYDLAIDPLARTNLAGAHPATASLRAQLRRMLAGG